jgi:phosphatidylinositol alpha-1,6-mannosyltransferase
LKVLIVSSEFPPGPGGIGRHAVDLSLALANIGFTIDVYSNIDYVAREAITSFENELPHQIRLYHFKRVGLITYALRIIKVLRAVKRNAYDRLVFTGKFPLWIGGVIKILYGQHRKVEFFVHGSEINPRSKLIRILTHWALSKADIIWAVSDFTRSILPDKVRLKKEIRILPNGIHTTIWPAPNSVEQYTDWKGYPIILTVGSISPRKGQHRVINALPALVQKFPNLHYHIVGMDENAGYLRNLINTLKLENNVTIHGRLPGKNELARAYKTSDIFMMLSENQADGDVEGFGIAILEANIYGLPAIGALGCGIEDAISPGINGELVDGDDADSITEAAIKLIEQERDYRPGIKDWVRSHDWSILIDEFLKPE